MIARVLLSAVGTLAILASCGGGVERLHKDDPEKGEATYIPMGHIHDEVCGHYYYNGRWYYVAEHMHRPGCGHHYIADRWCRIVPARVSPGHRHDSYCGHYYHHGEWYHLANHLHGSNCGHLYRNGVWVLD